MNARLALLILAAATALGCGGAQTSKPNPCEPPGCFTPQPNCAYTNRPAVFVGNAGSSSVSAFQLVAPNSAAGVGLVCGSPFGVTAPPTALAGGEPAGEQTYLIVLSAPQKTILLFRVDPLTSILTGPVATVTTPYTPVAAATLGGAFQPFYVANAEGSVSAYEISGQTASPTVTEIPGSPFPAGAGPAAIAATSGPPFVYVANSRSNDISGYSVDPATGALTPLPGSPFPAGTSPSSIKVWPPQVPSPTGGATVVIVTNAGSDNVSMYSVASDGSLTPVPGSPFPAGTTPSSVNLGDYLPMRHVYVANSGSNNVSGYSIDDATGVLTPLVGSPFPAGQGPSSIAVAFSDELVYVANTGSASMSVFTADTATGVLTPIPGSPFAVGQSPNPVIFFQTPE